MALPSYTMSSHELPKKTCRHLDGLLRRFWWIRSSDKDRFLCLKAWDSLCQPKSNGGLGFMRFEDANRAWLIAANVQRPWVGILLRKYRRNKSFREVTASASSSIIWKSIIHGRSLMIKGCLFQIGSGSTISIWNQPWVEGLQCCILSLHPHPLLIEREAVATKWVNDLIVPGTRSWNLS
ncbi:uncharacterized mitochondrial protein AtMg00310-like [Humulus lupulus]|uniref:uncharacterized mitochondrial protein AtMg00310-like n=1 Tax=Humulus lupulus TaxID=3486 RepID=UPI002B40A0BC|nr:uncharacterized mitochondrial protein AtMg00310-like [Humulus lupulus]